MSLPAEIWKRIFDLAANDDILLLAGVPTSLTESVWYQDDWEIASKWYLRRPEQARIILQRRNYATKKAIVSTCRQWRQIGLETLYRCLYFSQAMKAVALSAMLDSSSSSALATTAVAASTAASTYCQWTKRIQIGPFGPGSIKDIQENILAIIRHSPNVEIFVVERPLRSSFGPIVDALTHYASCNLHTIQLSVPKESVSKIIWALYALPRIVAVLIDFQSDDSSSEEVAHLGSAANLQRRLPHLQQISLRGFVGGLLKRLEEWELPLLLSFSIDDSSSTHVTDDDSSNDDVGFFKSHGLGLLLLDLNLQKIVDVPLVLDLCPNLQTFVFNADWRIALHDQFTSKIVNQPHQHIATIGLHGLYYAFGVGTRYRIATANGSRSRASYVTHSNDLNMAGLSKFNFPQLNRIRAVSKTVLEDLSKMNGPSGEDGYNRWFNWSAMCSQAGIRLEDCTGQQLGTLPEGNDEDSDEEEESEER